MNDHFIRIGEIKFTNVWPIFYYFSTEHLHCSVEWVTEVPTELNRKMREGEIDIGPISSFAYGANFEEYMLFPDLSVSARDQVNSILLFHREPLEEIASKTIALPTTSATSVNLLKIILGKFYQGNPQYFYEKPDLQHMMGQADAALLIGDDAIKAKWTNQEYRVTDLAAEWKKWTNKGMTFAVWAIRKQSVERFPEQMQEIYNTFLRSKEQALLHPEPLIQKACSSIGGTSDYWSHYFSELVYDFGPEQMEGLELYFKYAWELGLVEKQVPLQIWSNDKAVRVKR